MRSVVRAQKKSYVHRTGACEEKEQVTSGNDGKPFAIEFYEELGAKPVLDWMKRDLTVDQRRTLGHAMSEILQEQGSGVCDSEFGKWADSDVFYFRLRTDAGDIFRVYAHEYDGSVVLLFHGYDKGDRTAKSWETEQLKTARRRFTKWDDVRRAEAKAKKKAEADARSRANLGPKTARKKT